MADILGGLERLAKTRKSALSAKAADDAGTLEKRRVEAARAPYEMAGSSPLKRIEMVTSPRTSSPPRGHALDLNALGDWDLAHFQPLERKRPTTVSSRVEEAYKPENVRDFERYVRKGATEGGLEWYDMSPLSRVALQEMPPEEFRRLMAMNAATSARSSVQDQIKRASLAWYYKHQGIPWPMTNEALADVADPGYGHLAHDIHSKHLGPLVSGEEPGFSSTDQPKYASYFENFMGNMAPLTADTHYQALHGFPMKMTYNKMGKKWIEAPDFSKNVDYPFAEAFSGDRARRMGIPLPMYQAAAWVGGKEATGVRDARPFAAVYDEIIKRTADQMDLTPTEALKKHLKGQIPLLPIEKAEGGTIPRVLYHGTTRALKSLKPSKGKWLGSEDLGVHLGSTDTANRRLEDAASEGRRGAPNIMPLEHELNSPLRMDDIGNWKSPFRVKDELARLFPDRAQRLNKEFDWYKNTDSEEGAMDILRQHLRELGHDSIVYKNAYENGGDSYIALDPSRLRSVFSGAGEPIGSRTAVEPMPKGFAGGGNVSPLEKYIRHRLPKKYGSSEIHRLQDSSRNSDPEGFGGSSRDIFGLGDDKLVKIAKRPRGLYEMSLEGDERVEGHLPKLHWRSPDNELAVIERMKHTPGESTELFDPMKDRFEDLQARSPIPTFRRHRDDKWLAQMMRARGLEDFLPMDIHGPDFFMAPEHHWALRNPSKLSDPVLLDPGAMDYRIGRPQFEQQYAGPFRDILEERLSNILPPKFRAHPSELITKAINSGDRRLRSLEPLGIAPGTEDFLGPRASWPVGDKPETTDEIAHAIKKLMPRTPTYPSSMDPTFDLPPNSPRLVTGNAEGGLIGSKLRMIRNNLAGGGTPRNWLRGVKGSQFDEALAGLKGKTGRISPTNVEAAKLILAGKANGTPEHARQVLATDAKAEAMHKWIDTNLANYLVREHGTDTDPLSSRNMTHGRYGMPSAVKKIPAAEIPEMFKGIHEGQGWYGYSAEDRAKHLTLPPWLQKLAEQDTPRHLSQREYDRALGSEEFNMMAAKGNSKTLPDAPEALQRALEMQREARDKYQRKNAPKIELHDIDRDTWRNHYAPLFGDTLDYLSHRMGNDLKPEQLFRMSIPDAVRGSKEWHAAMKAAAEKKQLDALQGGLWLKEHKAYPDGFKWHQYNPEYIAPDQLQRFGGSDRRLSADELSRRGELENALKAEGDAMGHCVGDYCDDVLSGATQIYSLRDAKGRPHVTIEARPQLPNYGEIKKLLGETRTRELQAGRHSAMADNMTNEERDLMKERGLMGGSDIAQIKGKGNEKPIDEYLPYVQDFVRSGKWGEVGDLNNTGLLDSSSFYPSNTSSGQEYLMDQARRQFTKLKSTAYAPNVWNASRGRIKEQRFWSPDELHNILQEEALKKPGDPVFAKGGMVDHADFPIETADERLQRAQYSLRILLEEAKEPEYSPEQRAALAREIVRVERLIADLTAAGAGSGTSVKDGAAVQGVAPASDEGGDSSALAGGDELDGAIDGLLAGDDPETALMAEMLGLNDAMS